MCLGSPKVSMAPPPPLQCRRLHRLRPSRFLLLRSLPRPLSKKSVKHGPAHGLVSDARRSAGSPGSASS